MDMMYFLNIHIEQVCRYMFSTIDSIRTSEGYGVPTCEITYENLQVVFHDNKHHTSQYSKDAL